MPYFADFFTKSCAISLKPSGHTVNRFARVFQASQTLSHCAFLCTVLSEATVREVERGSADKGSSNTSAAAAGGSMFEGNAAAAAGEPAAVAALRNLAFRAGMFGLELPRWVG